jgi:hypothetical protein
MSEKIHQLPTPNYYEIDLQTDVQYQVLGLTTYIIQDGTSQISLTF